MRILTGLVAMVAIGGCMPVEKEVPTRDDPRYTCNAAKLQTMIGQAASQALGTEAVRASGARTMRWIEPGTMVTMEFREDRLNIHLDAQNRVTKITCG